MDSGSIATAAEDPKPGLDANGGEAPSADYGQQELVHRPQPDAADTAAKTIDDGKSETSDGQSDALRAGHDTEAIEDTRPSHDSNGSEDPSGDNSQREPTWSPQSDPADTTAKSVNNSGPDKNTGQSDAVSTGQNTEAAEDPTPSHATIGGEDPPSDSGQQEPVTHTPRPDTSHAAEVESNNDGEILESVIQYDSLSITENVMETDSATHILSTPQNVNTGLVEKTDDVEDVLVIAKPQSQSSQNLPSESDAKLDTERILTSDDEPGLESSSKPGSESDSESESESESVSVSGSDAESEDESIKVRLTRMSSENMKPEQVEANEALGQAIVDNKPDIFIDQIRKGASIKSRFDDEEDDGDRDQSTLFLAARHHSPDIAVEILKENSDRAFLVDNMTNTWTAAHIAAKNGSESVLRHIVEASKESGATLDVVNARNRDNSTPLYLAAREGYLKSVNMLLDNGADWKTQSGSDGTPLHAAAYHGHKDIVTRLLDLTGAKDLIGIPDGDGWTVLHCAALAGLDVTSLLDLYNNNEILEATTNETKLTPLHLAAANGHKNTVISLLAAGSDILARTSNKETVIHMAAESGNFDTLKVLANRVDRKTMLAEDNEKGTALYSAATTGRDFDSVCFLMGHEAFMPGRLEVGVSAKVNRRDVQELEKFLAEYINDNDIISEDAKPNLILHLIVQWAVFYGWLSIADTYLTKSGHLHGLTTKYGETLLHVAACNGQNGVVRLLLRRFQERNQKRKIIMKKVKNKEMGGIIALHFAAGNNHLGTMKLLLEGDLKDGISARSGKGETALYFAARGGHEDVVKYLLEEMEGDSLPKIIRERTKQMKSPLSHAAENGHKNVAKALLDELKRHDFNTDPVVAWNQLIDIAQTGLEDYVKEIITDKIKLPNILRKSAKEVFPDLKFTGLLWAVYYGHYEVVWWLLRRNGPAILTSPIFEDAMDMVHKLVEELTDTMGNNTVELSAEEKKAKKLWYGAIKDCLCSPPRVANKYDQYDKDGTPNVPQLAKKKEDICKEYRATIVDFYKKDGIVSFAPLSRSIYDIIYDKASSIDEIMAGAGMDLKEPKSANDVLRTGQLTREPTAEEFVAGELASRETAGEPPAGEPAVEAPAAEASTLKPPAVEPSAKEPTAAAQKAGTQLQAPVAKQDQKLKQKQEHDDGYKFRWIHVPANNMEWIQDLLSRSFLTNEEHRPVSSFVRGSKQELQRAYADSTDKYQLSQNMKPLCMRRILKTNQQENTPGSLEQTSKSKVTANPGTNTALTAEQETSYQQRESRTEIKKTLSGSENVALYMPYLTFSKAYVGNGNPVQLPNTLADRLVGAYERENIHELRTLDRFYYTSLKEKDIQKRNKDQVLTKYIKKKKNEKGTAVKDEELRDGIVRVQLPPQPAEISNEDETGLILQVDQLWLWVIDGDKIITSSSYQTEGEPDIILKRVFKHLIEGRDERHPPSSPEQLLQLIVSSATGVIEQQKVILPEKGLLLSVLDIFENAIGDIEDKEINLFQEFEKTLQKPLASKNPAPCATCKNGENNDSNTIKNDPEDQFDLIREAITHLVSIKDILDELGILKSLVKDQKKVWHDAFSNHTTDAKSLAKDEKKVWHDAFSEYTIEEEYMNSREPSEILEALDEMVADATRVERSIKDLLDLKQKQANLSEAQSSRIQAEETLSQGLETARQGKEMARQGRTLMVFTIVTIVFLPMSFLAALFALDITVFPHATDKLSYTPGWIFPMIFGPSAAMSIPAIYFAFHVEKAISIWERLKNPQRIFWPKVEDKSKTNHDGNVKPQPISHVSMNRNEVDVENCRPNEEPSNGIMRRIRRAL